MHRISTDAEWLKTGRVVIDADGIPVDVPDRSDMDAADNALDEKIDNRIPSGLALRLDTSVGTRVFAGDTMIHGDTGLRSVPELSTSLDVSTSSLHGVFIRRVGDLVSLTVLGVWIAGQWITETLPSGFRPLSGEYLASRGVAAVDGDVRTFGNSVTLLRLSFGTPFPASGVAVSLNASWQTADPWPTTLPGLPA